MGIMNWSDDIILVDLSVEPEAGEELRKVITLVRDSGDCDVVIDFSVIDIFTSSSLSSLLSLRKLLLDCDHKLVLCSIASSTKGIFTVIGLEESFDIADDKFVALAGLQIENYQF